MTANILIIGEKYSRLSKSITGFRQNNMKINVKHISEDEFNPHDCHTYLFENNFIVSPYRMELLQLSIGRTNHGGSVSLILATDASRCYTDKLVSGGVCDAVSSSSHDEICNIIFDSVINPVHVSNISNEAMVQFVGYAFRSSRLFVNQSDQDEAFQCAMDFFNEWKIKRELIFESTELKRRDQNGLPYRPFEFLKLMKDGVIKNRIKHGKYVGSLVEGQYSQLLDGLKKVGMIKKQVSGEKETFEMTDKFRVFFNALQVSLHQLSSFDNNSIIASPVFTSSKGLMPNIDIFVIMPFSPELMQTYETIKSAASSLKLKVMRGDEFVGDHAIISEIWDAIRSCRFVVADLTGLNPNVFYEIGIAHTVGKKCILISRDVNSLPFDLRHLRTSIYSNTAFGHTSLLGYLKRSIRNAIMGDETLSEILGAVRHGHHKSPKEHN